MVEEKLIIGNSKREKRKGDMVVLISGTTAKPSLYDGVKTNSHEEDVHVFYTRMQLNPRPMVDLAIVEHHVLPEDIRPDPDRPILIAGRARFYYHYNFDLRSDYKNLDERMEGKKI